MIITIELLPCLNYIFETNPICSVLFWCLSNRIGLIRTSYDFEKHLHSFHCVLIQHNIKATELQRCTFSSSSSNSFVISTLYLMEISKWKFSWPNSETRFLYTIAVYIYIMMLIWTSGNLMKHSKQIHSYLQPLVIQSKSVTRAGSESLCFWNVW